MTALRELLRAQCEASGLAVARSGAGDSTPIALVADYLAAMLAENERVNLTAIRDPERAALLHGADSLAIAELPPSPGRVLDLGTGNGFPGVAMAAIAETCEVTLCDRTRRKVSAIERALDAAKWPDARRRLVTTRWLDAAQAKAAEPALVRAFRRITARAVATPEVCLQLAGPLLAEGGDIVLWLSDETATDHRLPKRSGWRSDDFRYELRHADGRGERSGVLRRYLRA